MKKLYNKAQEYVHHPYSTVIFFALVFTESFFFMPVNTLLTLYGVARSKDVFKLALLAIIASIVGGVLAYTLGFFLWSMGFQNTLEKVIAPETLNYYIDLYRQKQAWTVFGLSLAPWPYKLVTIIAGFARVPFKSFLISITAARTLRFLILATALHFFGGRVQQIIDRYFYFFVILGLGTLLIAGWLFKG
jgi:membrane protein YqaA with SNARE-associated domain